VPLTEVQFLLRVRNDLDGMADACSRRTDPVPSLGYVSAKEETMMRIRFASIVIAVLLMMTVAAPPVRSADIVGRVIDQGRGSVAGLELSVANQAGAPVAMTKSDATGSYSFHDIAPGIYHLNFEGQTAVAYVPRNGLTVDWGVGRNLPAVAVAKPGVATASKADDPAASASK
jgi:hypothetical protein